MRKNNTNITLRTAANLSGGTIAALRLGINELKSIRPRKIRKQPMPAGSEPLKLSVIICSAGIAKTLASAVKSALNQTASDDDYEVICVLNGANTSSFVSALPEKVILLHEMRQGISYARNCGANAARGEILLYIDDDALADSKLVQSMIDTFSLRKKAAVVGGQIFLTVPQPRPKILLYGRENLWSAYTVPYKGYREVREQYAFPYGACFAVRKSVLEKLGGFCESYGRVGNDYGGGEETALCFAALKNGWRIGIQPKAHVIHNVDPKRFCRLHVKKTIRAGILTSYRLIQDGYANYVWDKNYIRERIKIYDMEISRLKKNGKHLECFYKKCEKDAFNELLRRISTNA